MKKTQFGATILEGSDIADLPLISRNAQILEDEILKDRSKLESLEESIKDVPQVFHDVEPFEVKEEMNPGDFSTGITLCNQRVTDFPSIGKAGVSITFSGSNNNYAQIFITKDGDIWSRRSNSFAFWAGEWYNSKKNIDELYNKIDILNKEKADNKDLSRSSTIVIANYDSHENSKKAADIVIAKEENAAVKINQAIQSLDGIGGEIKLMEGNYQLDSKISVLVDNITLRGVGRATVLTTRNLSVGTRGSMVEVGEDLNGANNQVYGFNISDLTIDGNKTKENYRGIGLWGAVHCTINNVESKNSQSNGIQLTNNSSAIISDSKCTHNQSSGILLADNSSAIISNSKCSSNQLDGILLADNSSATISNSKCSSNQLNGIQLVNDSSATISNINIIENKVNGISVSSTSTHILIQGAVLKDNALDPQYTNEGQLNLGVNTDFDTSNMFVTGCKVIDTKGNTRGVTIRGNNHALTNTQFVGAFKEKINDGGKGTQLIGNVGV